MFQRRQKLRGINTSGKICLPLRIILLIFRAATACSVIAVCLQGRVPLRRAGAHFNRLRRRAPHRPAGTQAATPPAAAGKNDAKYISGVAKEPP